MFAGYKSKKLEARRAETLLDIRREQKKFEVMVQRAEIAGDNPDPTILATVRKRLAEVEQRAIETNVDEFYYLLGAATTITITWLHVSASRNKERSKDAS
jgi:hypothetical protein